MQCVKPLRPASAILALLNLHSPIKKTPEHAARLIEAADGLLITAGAGMGIDSGLPDFRGPQGFWKAYPALGRAGIRFEQIARPASLRSTPELAWGFYGHRIKFYRETIPHPGFGILLTIAALLPYGEFVFTSNVDGQFQKAGFAEERVAECHGSIHYLQCLEQCNDAIWPADSFVPEVNGDGPTRITTADMPGVRRGLARSQHPHVWR